MLQSNLFEGKIDDSEDVARLLFSPLFMSEGVLSQKAFSLEEKNKETYISVLRSSLQSFRTDMEGITKEGNFLYGYALLNVGEIRSCNIQNIKFDVLPRSTGKRKSHAGIFTTINNINIKGGMPQSADRLLARMFLVNLAQKRIISFS